MAVTAGRSTRWCRELWTVRTALRDLLDAGAGLTDPRVLTLSRRLDRLTLEMMQWPAGGAVGQRPVRHAKRAG